MPASVPKYQIEALLFSSGKPMQEDQLAALAKLAPDVVKKALKELETEYAARTNAIIILNDEQGWRMSIRPEYVGVVKNVVADTELTRPCLETLAVIAHRYPKVLQSQVIDTRGSGAYEHIAELERLGFISRSSEGRSYAIKLTEKFFQYFDVADGKGLKQFFKGVKLPTKPEAQQKLGGLDVVPVAPEPAHKKNDLEVVDVAPKKEEPVKPTIPVEQKTDEAHQAFLDDLDARINALTERNDAHAADPMLQRQIPQVAPEEGSAEAPAPEPAQPEAPEEKTPKKRRKAPSA